MLEPYTEQELFNLRHVVVEPDTIIDRFKCTLVCSINGKDEIIGKRKWKVKDIKGEGYIGFDAFNHSVENAITQRIRITYVGHDYVCVFVREPARGNVPHLHRVSLKDNDYVTSVDCGNGIVYKLITTVREKELPVY